MAASGTPWDRYGSGPIAVEGGITTSKQRGAMAETWWSRRFVAVLESYGLGGRMGRGRSYARRGQVISLEVQPGWLVAEVQGSRSVPYDVTIALKEPSAKAWKAIETALGERVGFVAALLAGEVPAELEAVFAAAGTTLLPTTWSQLSARCSCPDFGNPCKHIAAVLYVFADQLETDPWLLLAWRGRARDDLLAPLRARAGAEAMGAPVNVAPWWPFGTTAPAAIDALRGADSSVPVAEPADPADAVLQRCSALEVSINGNVVTAAISAAYSVIRDGARG